MKNENRHAGFHPGHRAPYYGGETCARTLQEAFGPYAHLQVRRRSKALRCLPWIVIAVSCAAIVVSLVVPSA